MNLKSKLVLGFFILLVTLSIILIPKILKVGNVSCVSQFGPCNQALTEKLKTLEGKPIGKAPSEISDVLTKEVLVKDFSIQFKLPNRLSVSLIERKPKFALKILQGVLALVDEEGYIVAIEQMSNLPLVTIPGSIGNVGEKVTSENLFVLSLIDDLFTFYQVKDGEVEDGKFKVTLNDGIRVIFPLTGDREVLISALSLVLKRFEGLDAKPSEIDLRYKNPVIRE